MSSAREKRAEAKAAEVRPEWEASNRLKLLTLRDAAIAAEEELDWVIPEFLAAGEKAVIAGPPKSFKTWFALHLIRCVALAEPVLGDEVWQVQKPQRVLLVEEEGSRQRFARRLMQVFEGEPDAPFDYVHRGGFSLVDPEHIAWLVGEAKRTDARLIVIDPLQRVTPGVNENDAAETGPAWDAIHRLAAETGAAVLVLHHARKGGEGPSMDFIRGSSRIAGEVDLIVGLKKIEGELGALEVYLEGRDLVRSDGESGNLKVAYEVENPHRMRRAGFQIHVKGPRNAVGPALLEVLRTQDGPLPTTEIHALVEVQLGESRDISRINRELNDLAKEGEVVKSPGKGREKLWELVRE